MDRDRNACDKTHASLEATAINPPYRRRRQRGHSLIAGESFLLVHLYIHIYSHIDLEIVRGKQFDWI